MYEDEWYNTFGVISLFLLNFRIQNTVFYTAVTF